MFSLLCLILAVFIQQGATSVAIDIQPLSENSYHQGCKGYDEKLYQFGESWYGNDCVKYSCHRFNETASMIDIYGCGTVDVSAFKPECISYPRHLKYPKCCFPVIKCKN